MVFNNKYHITKMSVLTESIAYDSISFKDVGFHFCPKAEEQMEPVEHYGYLFRLCMNEWGEQILDNFIKRVNPLLRS